MLCDRDSLAYLDAVRADGRGGGDAAAATARGLPDRRRRRLERVRRADAHRPGRRQPPALPAGARVGLAAVACPDSTPPSATAAGSPTSAAATAGPRSASPGPTRRSPSTATTSTLTRSTPRAATPRPRAWATGSRFTLVDAASVPTAGDYDLVTAFECVHDLPDPVGVLRSARRMVRPGGTVLVMDERVPEAFTGPGRPRRAADVRHLDAGLPARRSVARRLGRHRHGHATRHPAGLRPRAPASPTSRSCRSSTTCSASTGCSVERCAGCWTWCRGQGPVCHLRQSASAQLAWAEIPCPTSRGRSARSMAMPAQAPRFHALE